MKQSPTRLPKRSWLRCRVLAFLATSYFDDVRTRKSTLPPGSLALVGVDGSGQVWGLLDVERIGDELVTIDSIAVHPDHQRRGLGNLLLQQALALLPSRGVLDAWTREDAEANSWYRNAGFSADHQYLHAYFNGEAAEALQGPPGLVVHSAFIHANFKDETATRALSERVYRCTRYVRHLG